MKHTVIAESSAAQLNAYKPQVELYQSTALDDNPTFSISCLKNLELATVRHNKRTENSCWIVETGALSICEAESLATDLHRQHLQFHIRNGRFRVMA